jgi:hypothetical protein
MTLKKITNEPLAAVLVFTAVPLAIIFLAIMPLIINVRDIGFDILRRQALVDNYELRISKARDFIQFCKQQKEDFNNLENIFVDSQMPLGFIGALEAAAKETGVIMEFSPSVPQQAGKNEWPSLIMNAELTGGISNIWQFAEKIENMPYLVAVQSFEVHAAKAPSSDAAVQTQEESQTYGRAHILLKVYAKTQSK